MSTEPEAVQAIGLETPYENSSPGSDIIFPKISQITMAWLDIKEGLQKWRIWLMLAYQDIKLRYRRSIIGPFWLTLSMAITVYSMGYLYSHLFHGMTLGKYYPFLVAGMLAWSLISAIIIDVTDGLNLSESYIKQIKLPYSLYIHRIAARNMLIFLHNLLVLVPILVIFHEYAQINFHTLLLIPGLLIVYINGFLYGLVLIMVASRYKDISQIIKSLVQVVFFITPVMWGPEMLGPNKRYLVDLNPFYAFIEVIRAPLIGSVPTANNLLAVAIMTVIGCLISAYIFTRYRARIVYWL